MESAAQCSLLEEQSIEQQIGVVPGGGGALSIGKAGCVVQGECVTRAEEWQLNGGPLPHLPVLVSVQQSPPGNPSYAKKKRAPKQPSLLLPR